MENNQQPTSEISNQQAGNSEEHARSPPTLQASRLYECTFCKKGFSNAQALGGHMNIHRKDKAKLKQASNQNQRLINAQAIAINPLTPSTTTPPPPPPPPDNNIGKPFKFTSSSQVLLMKTSINPKRKPSTFSSSDDPHQEEEDSFYGSCCVAEEFISGQGSFGAELDLELRLGHEPSRSTVAMETRKFF